MDQVCDFINQYSKDIFPEQLVKPAIIISRYLTGLYFEEYPYAAERVKNIGGGILISAGMIMYDLPLQNRRKDIAILSSKTDMTFDELRKIITRPDDYNITQKNIAQKLNAPENSVREIRRQVLKIYHRIIKSELDEYKLFLRLLES